MSECHTEQFKSWPTAVRTLTDGAIQCVTFTSTKQTMAADDELLLVKTENRQLPTTANRQGTSSQCERRVPTEDRAALAAAVAR